MLLKYDEASTIPIKSLVHFKEYKLDRRENKELTHQVDGELFVVIPAGEKLSSDLIEIYYRDLTSEDYTAVSYSPFIRLVLVVGSDRMGVPIYQTVTLNTYYMSVGLQTLEYEESFTPQPTTPIEILGFNSYDIGKKFKA